jgi:hypothetical protein
MKHIPQRSKCQSVGQSSRYGIRFRHVFRRFQRLYQVAFSEGKVPSVHNGRIHLLRGQPRIHSLHRERYGILGLSVTSMVMSDIDAGLVLPRWMIRGAFLKNHCHNGVFISVLAVTTLSRSVSFKCLIQFHIGHYISSY